MGFTVNIEPQLGAAAPPGAAQLRRKIGHSSGWVTRHIKSIEKLLPSFQGATSAHNVEALVSTRDKLANQKAKVDGIYELLFEESEAVQQEDTDALDQLRNRVDETLARVAEAFNKSDRSVAARPEAFNAQRNEPTRDARPKPNEALKPFKLTQDHNPVELANWILQFKAYYTSSRFKQCPRCGAAGLLQECHRCQTGGQDY